MGPAPGRCFPGIEVCDLFAYFNKGLPASCEVRLAFSMESAPTSVAMHETVEYNACVLSRMRASWAMALPMSGRCCRAFWSTSLEAMYLGHECRLSRSTVFRKKKLLAWWFRKDQILKINCLLMSVGSFGSETKAEGFS